ncbi:hypothetical protein CONPUDRAFT_160070 [Coniophora puteana RWD-64-598 SS2]|uniref:Secreted peptide n=1 Tax=Coniophora puteana (strain RWD-64-598) TaxID=741705 RepID=R7SDW6_CONPW|nr:uncharacterized protein CONPUDRAFT_160070 [Coniophora puteana RWD-64-598 SS2]EIW74361.1 hypothetical protein CONPUDRAFT_160070 [Coniophora puteana RWD-64-598 SS2]
MVCAPTVITIVLLVSGARALGVAHKRTHFPLPPKPTFAAFRWRIRRRPVITVGVDLHLAIALCVFAVVAYGGIFIYSFARAQPDFSIATA